MGFKWVGDLIRGDRTWKGKTRYIKPIITILTKHTKENTI